MSGCMTPGAPQPAPSPASGRGARGRRPLPKLARVAERCRRDRMARANPQFALRPFLPQDAPLLAEIFRASVEELTEDDYNPAQQEAWAAVADDLEAFAERLGKHLTLIATMEGSPVGFISLDAPTEIGLLYVHPAVAGQGVGAMLYDAVEKLVGRARRAASVGRGERHRARVLRAPRIRRRAAQHRLGRQRMAEQHHDEEEACQRSARNEASGHAVPAPLALLHRAQVCGAVVAVALALKYFGVW